MTTVEDQLRDLGRCLPASGGELPPAAEVMRRGEGRRRRRRASRAALAVTAAVAVGGFSVSRASSGPASGVEDVATAPGDRPPAASTTSTTTVTTSATTSTTPSSTTAAPGASRVAVPDIVGLEADRASEALRSLGFRVVVAGPDATAGTRRRVVAQSPAAEAVVEAGTDVRITVEDGGP